MNTPFKMKGWSPFTLIRSEKKVNYDKIKDDGTVNPDVDYRKVVKTSKKGKTTTKIHGEALSEKQWENPAQTKYTKVKRQPYIYKGKEGDVKIWSRKFKSKTDVSGSITKQKEKVVHGEGSKMTKRKQHVVKFGKHKGKVKSKTVSYDKGKRTITKSYSDKIDTSPILKKNK